VVRQIYCLLARMKELPRARALLAYLLSLKVGSILTTLHKGQIYSAGCRHYSAGHSKMYIFGCSEDTYLDIYTPFSISHSLSLSLLLDYNV
jgi:hypothetical protein